ncbi:hypothetical protein PF008_g14955 [Phytophthora fragariae]|uniref:Uncharacterized protein n=1 Tax=Phytophthora fragariae TaxID=53985 RepID=A0A6G0RFZ6_9STRA|nr:hypothetical protein PF008_g14955 [Phytophthora fragariae]
MLRPDKSILLSVHLCNGHYDSRGTDKTAGFLGQPQSDVKLLWQAEFPPQSWFISVLRLQRASSRHRAPSATAWLSSTLTAAIAHRREHPMRPNDGL